MAGGADGGGGLIRPGLTAREAARKTVHVGAGLLAFTLRWLGPWGGVLLAGSALLFNLFLFPRLGGRLLWRDDERERGHSTGIVLYPLAVLLLVVVFHRRLEVAAAGWGLLAFGDGMATVVGGAFGRRALPWNRDKSWAGTTAYWFFGTLAAWLLIPWTAPQRYGWAEDGLFLLAVCAAVAGVAALLESWRQGLDDNLGVPLVAGLLLLGLLLTEGSWWLLVEPAFLARLVVGLLVTVLAAAVAYGLGAVKASGAVAGVMAGTAVWAFLGGGGFSLFALFVVLGSALSRVGYRRKEAARLAQEDGGRRGARHAAANCAVAVVCALLAALTPYGRLFALAFAAALATAAADTAGSEVGQLYGRRAWLPTTWRRVPPGTDGAVSLEGTLAGLAAALLVAQLGVLAGLYPWWGALVVLAAAVAGTTAESLLGAATRTRHLLDNEALNLLNTLLGALAALGLAALLTLLS